MLVAGTWASNARGITSRRNHGLLPSPDYKNSPGDWRIEPRAGKETRPGPGPRLGPSPRAALCAVWSVGAPRQFRWCLTPSIWKGVPEGMLTEEDVWRSTHCMHAVGRGRRLVVTRAGIARRSATSTSPRGRTAQTASKTCQGSREFPTCDHGNFPPWTQRGVRAQLTWSSTSAAPRARTGADRRDPGCRLLR
jgi:hypothetical protein